MKTLKHLLLFLPMIFLMTSCLTHEVMYYGAHTVLPDVDKDMNTGGYWIAQHPSPDTVIMDEAAIKDLNDKIINASLYVNRLESLDALFDSVKFKTEQSGYIKALMKSKLFFNNGKRVDKAFFLDIGKNMKLDQLESEVKFGFLIKTSDLRGIPTDFQVNDIRLELFFDTFQFSSLSAGTPVAILHKSLDNKWFYVTSRIVSGWVSVSQVAICTKEKFLDIIKNKFAVVTSAKTSLFLDEGLTRYYDFARMGTLFYLTEILPTGSIKVYFPAKNEAGELMDSYLYLDKNDIHEGYLTYTPRTIINQSFKSLNSPYGWAGMFGEQDCSQFLCEIFATAGIYLPRNSSNQALIGNSISGINSKTTEEDKIRFIKENGIQGITLLRMPGHITLYLGYNESNIYIIHAAWAYSEKYQFRDTVRLINKVTVSTLKLGEGTKKGSFIKRINKATIIN